MGLCLMKTNALNNGEEEVAIYFFSEIKSRHYCNALTVPLVHSLASLQPISHSFSYPLMYSAVLADTAP